MLVTRFLRLRTNVCGGGASLVPDFCACSARLAGRKTLVKDFAHKRIGRLSKEPKCVLAPAWKRSASIGNAFHPMRFALHRDARASPVAPTKVASARELRGLRDCSWRESESNRGGSETNMMLTTAFGPTSRMNTMVHNRAPKTNEEPPTWRCRLPLVQGRKPRPVGSLYEWKRKEELCNPTLADLTAGDQH